MSSHHFFHCDLGLASRHGEESGNCFEMCALFAKIGWLMKLIRGDAFDASVIVNTANLLPGILHELPFEKS